MSPRLADSSTTRSPRAGRRRWCPRPRTSQQQRRLGAHGGRGPSETSSRSCPQRSSASSTASKRATSSAFATGIWPPESSTPPVEPCMTRRPHFVESALVACETRALLACQSRFGSDAPARPPCPEGKAPAKSGARKAFAGHRLGHRTFNNRTKMGSTPQAVELVPIAI